jgi:hypothetical protein
VPIRRILETDHGGVFEPEDVETLTTAFEAALSKLGLVDRSDPAAVAVAKLIIVLARKGERDPSRICDRVITLWRNRPRS